MQMKIKDAVNIVDEHNQWRRGAEIEMCHPEILGQAIDCLLDFAKSHNKTIKQVEELLETE